jgi:hypothetical protein
MRTSMTDRQTGIVCLVLGLASLAAQRGWQLSVAGAIVLVLGLLLVVLGGDS